MAAQTVTKKRKAQVADEKPLKKPKKTTVNQKTTTVSKAPSSKEKSKITTATTVTTTKKAPADRKDSSVSKVSKTSAAKKSAKPKKASAEEQIALPPSDDSAEEEDEIVDPTTAALLAGFESSSDEDEDDNPKAIDTSALPKPPAAALAQTATAAGNDDDDDAPGVVYVGRIPHGFFEHQMRAYFSQFGDITRLRLSRNKRTGASRHYAFIEFASREVASIVADTMDNYLLFGHIMKVKLLSAEQIHSELFKGAGKRFKAVPWNRIERFKVDKTDREGWKKRIANEEKRRKGKEARLKKLGYVFEAPQLASVDSVPVQTQALEAGKEQLAIEHGSKAETLDDVLNDTPKKEEVAVKVGKKSKARRST